MDNALPAPAAIVVNPPATDLAAAEAFMLVVNPPAAAAGTTSAMSESSMMTEKDIELVHMNANTALDQGPENYFQEVCKFGVLLNNTANMVRKLKEANQEFNSVTELAAMKEVKGRMEKDMDEVGKMAHEIKEKLKKMIANHFVNRNNPGCERGTVINITWMSLTIALKAKLEERKIDLQNLGKTIRPEYLEVIQKRTFTVAGIKLSDEVIRVIDIVSVVQMLTLNPLHRLSAEQPQMVAAVDEIMERHAVATDLCKNILEVQQIFERMVLLVEAGEKLDKELENAAAVTATAAQARRCREKREMRNSTMWCLGLLAAFTFITLMGLPLTSPWFIH